VQQILMNLVHNAIKFTNNGTVLVRLAVGGGARPAPPSASAIPASASVRSSAMRCSRLFPAGCEALRQFEGTGLGLHLSRKLASLLHGEILFDSEYGGQRVHAGPATGRIRKGDSTCQHVS
jgi:signal transduction histidine kinase